MRDLRARSAASLRFWAFLFGSVATVSYADVAHCQIAASDEIQDAVSAGDTAVRNRQFSSSGLTSTGTSQVMAVPTQIIPERRFDVVGTAGVGYDTNATHTHDGSTSPFGKSPGDVIAPLLVNGDIMVPSGPNLFSLVGAVGYTFYAKHRDLDSELVRLNGGYRRNLNACDASTDGTFSRVRTDYANADLPDFGKNLETTEIIEGSFSCTLDSGLRPFASVSYSHGTNSLITRALNDYDNVVYGGGITLGNVLGSTIGVVGNISQNVYPNRIEGIGEGARNVNVKSIGGYFRRAAARILQVEIQLNYTMVGKTVGAPSFHGLSGSGSIHFEPGGRLTFNLNAYRTVETSLSFDSSYNIETGITLEANEPINQRLRVGLVVAHLERQIRGTFGVDANALTDDRTNEVTGQAGYSLTPVISFGLAVSYTDRTANEAFYNYSGVRVTATGGVRF